MTRLFALLALAQLLITPAALAELKISVEVDPANGTAVTTLTDSDANGELKQFYDSLNVEAKPHAQTPELRVKRVRLSNKRFGMVCGSVQTTQTQLTHCAIQLAAGTDNDNYAITLIKHPQFFSASMGGAIALELADALTSNGDHHFEIVFSTADAVVEFSGMRGGRLIVAARQGN